MTLGNLLQKQWNELGRVGERHHVTGAGDQAVIRLLQAPAHDFADLPVHDRGFRPLDDMDGKRHGRQRVHGDGRVEENVPEIAARTLFLDKRVAPLRGPRRKGSRPVIEVDELPERGEPVARLDVRALVPLPILNATKLG